MLWLFLAMVIGFPHSYNVKRVTVLQPFVQDQDVASGNEVGMERVESTQGFRPCMLTHGR